jgi:hypothetical protein
LESLRACIKSTSNISQQMANIETIARVSIQFLSTCMAGGGYRSPAIEAGAL